MKKLMIALVVAAIAVASNAASVSWKTGTNIQGPGEDGAFNTTTLAKNSFNMYVWTVDAATYASIDLTTVYDSYKDKTTTATATGTWGTLASQGQTATTTAADSATVYGVVLLTYNDGVNDWYIANKASATTDALGGGATISNLAKNIGGGSGSAITGWTQAVPEPTSGLLLLLGVAGLALKRKVG